MNATHMSPEEATSGATALKPRGLSAARVLLLLVYEETDPRARDLRRAAVALVQSLRQLCVSGGSPSPQLERLDLELQLARETELLPPTTVAALEDLRAVVARGIESGH